MNYVWRDGELVDLHQVELRVAVGGTPPGEVLVVLDTVQYGAKVWLVVVPAGGRADSRPLVVAGDEVRPLRPRG